MEFWLQAEQVPVDALDAKVRQQTLGATPRKAAKARQLNGMLKVFLIWWLSRWSLLRDGLQIQYGPR